ncbi:MAG TPA: hypothetical protein VFZ73_12970 [Gemmatimonadaceae bacterium]
MRNAVVWRRWQWLAALALVIAAIVATAVWRRSSSTEWSDGAAGARRLVVHPFDVHASIRGWERTGFEDSLAALLSANSQVVALAGTRDPSDADFVLDGDVSPEGGQFMITLRLRPAGQRAATWTATFWRKSFLDSAVTRDLAIAVKEALHLDRR